MLRLSRPNIVISHSSNQGADFQPPTRCWLRKIMLIKNIQCRWSFAWTMDTQMKKNILANYGRNSRNRSLLLPHQKRRFFFYPARANGWASTSCRSYNLRACDNFKPQLQLTNQNCSMSHSERGYTTEPFQDVSEYSIFFCAFNPTQK